MHAVAAGLGWDITLVVVGHAGKLGQVWHQELTSQGICKLSFSEFSPALVEQSEVEIITLDDRLLKSSSVIWENLSLKVLLGTSLPHQGGTAAARLCKSAEKGPVMVGQTYTHEVSKYWRFYFFNEK